MAQLEHYSDFVAVQLAKRDHSTAITSEVVTLIDRAIDHDQAIILTAELLRRMPNPKRDERSEALLDQIIQTALKNSSLIARFGKTNLPKNEMI